jgi:hypothetical protein
MMIQMIPGRQLERLSHACRGDGSPRVIHVIIDLQEYDER